MRENRTGVNRAGLGEASSGGMESVTASIEVVESYRTEETSMSREPSVLSERSVTRLWTCVQSESKDLYDIRFLLRLYILW
jgi:hypothetical protein